MKCRITFTLIERGKFVAKPQRNIAAPEDISRISPFSKRAVVALRFINAAFYKLTRFII